MGLHHCGALSAGPRTCRRPQALCHPGGSLSTQEAKGGGFPSESHREEPLQLSFLGVRIETQGAGDTGRELPEVAAWLRPQSLHPSLSQPPTGLSGRREPGGQTSRELTLARLQPHCLSSQHLGAAGETEDKGPLLPWRPWHLHGAWLKHPGVYKGIQTTPPALPLLPTSISAFAGLSA